MNANIATAQPLTQIVTVKDKFTVSKELLNLFYSIRTNMFLPHLLPPHSLTALETEYSNS